MSSNPSRWNLGALLAALLALFVAGCGTGVPLVGNDDAGVVISFDRPQSDIEGDINYDGSNDFVPGELPEVPVVGDVPQGCEDSDLDGFGRGVTCRGVDCNDHDPLVTNQCYEGCFWPDVREGCACEPGAQPLPCDLTTGRSSGIDGVCNPGQRTCSPNRNGTTWSWGACERWRPDYPGARYVGPISACPGSCLPTCRRQIICPTATDPAASALPPGSSGVGIGLGTPAVFCPTGTPNGGVTSTCTPVMGTAYTRGVTPSSVPWVDACAAPGHLTYLPGTDDGYVSSTLPFAFQFYGSAESTVGISSNGILSFPDVPTLGSNHLNATLPYGLIPNAIFPFWDDLMTRTTGVCVTASGTAPTRQHVVQWADSHFCCTNDPTVHMDFEVLLSEGTHIIDVRYNRMDDPSGRASGSSATVGIQQGTGVRYDLVSYNTTAAVSTGSSIRWLPTSSSTLCSRGVYNRVFDGNCAPTGAADRDLFTATLPFWGQFNFTSNVPTGTSIQFEVRAADTTAGLASATPVRLSDAPAGVTSAPVSIDLRASLRAASTPGNELWNRRYLQLTAYLNPSADGGTAPTLISTETQYTCLPRETDVQCRAGGSCQHPTPCHAGVIACVTTPGAARPREVCNDAGILPAGTTCGTGMVCNPSGACVPCSEGGTCTPTSADPGCATGRVSCATGLPVCNATLYPAGTPCGSMGSTDYIRTATAAPWRDVCALPGHTTHLTSTDDGASLEPLPFPFRYYSTAVSSIGISSNGMLQFGGLAGLTAYTNGPLPNGSTPDTLFAFWDDLETRAPGICTATVGLAPNRTHVVQWSDLYFFPTDDPTVHLNFQVALNEGTNTIDVVYGTMTGGNASGASATVGLQEGTGSRYQQIAYDTAGSIMSNSSYRWTPSGGMVCNTMGRCVSCTDRTPCSPTGNPCDTGITVCTSGVPTCALTGRLTPGTSCGTDQVCNPSGSCIPCREGAACSTGVTCEIGAVSCTTGVPTCRRVGYEAINTPCVVSGSPGRCDGMSTCVPCGATELCDGIDNDCDGMVDEGLTRSCYSGAAGTSGVGICRPGTQSCVSAAWGRCAGEVTPATERCNATDDDCDGAVDEDFLGGVAAAPASPRVLVYQPGEGSTAPAYPAGSVITRVTDAAWRSMTTAQFASYNVIVIGSGCTYSSCQGVFDTRATWAPAVGGRVVVETSHALEHGQYVGPRAWFNWIIRGNGTGLYVSDDESTRNLDFMSPFGSFTSHPVTFDPGNIVMPGHAAMAGVTNGDLTMSNNHSSMTAWPSGFVVLARPGTIPSDAMVVARDTGTSGTGLGSSCTAGVGACARTGTYVCTADGSGTECNVTAGTPSTEVCDGVDNDCDGMTDEGLTRSCYGGPAGTAGVGACTAGTESCAAGAWTACVGEVRPSAETCDNADNDCDGMVDESLTRACYTGAAGTSGVGTCRPGTQTCSAGSWGSTCPGEVVPRTELCDSLDDNCNGTVDDPFIGGVGAAPSAPRVLVFAPGEGSTASAYPAGSVVTRVTDAAWRSMTRAQFETYNVIVIGSGCTYSGCQAVYDTRNTWGPAVAGRVVVETSHALEHGQYNGPRAWFNWIVRGNGTGLYVSDDESTRSLDFMSPFGSFVSRSAGYDPGNIVMAGHPAMAGVTNGDITMSNNHSSMTSWPSGFVVLARPGPYPAEAMVVARDTGASGTGLGAACTAGMGACVRTGMYICAPGGMGTTCSATAGPPSAEVCDNVDNDCDGMIDEGITRSCYTGPSGTSGVGACAAGTETCAAGAWGTCVGQVLPSTEVCDNVDNDCDGATDESLTRSCYTGPSGTSGVGACRPGTQTCSAGSWGSTCPGETLPARELCDSVDNDCNGTVDNGFAGLPSGTPYASCAAVPAGSASGVYTVDPDGTGPAAPVSVWCDMATHGGGWMQIGRVGPSATPASRGLFNADRSTASLASGAPPSGAEFANWDLSRFNAYGSDWTVRVNVDSNGNQSHWQYTFLRPRVSQTVLPATAGQNWLPPSATPSLMEYLVRSTNAGLTNNSWLQVQGWDPTSATIMMFTYRRASSSAACLDGSGATQLCHAPAGGVTNESGLNGTYTSAFSNNDGISHAWGRGATYWLKGRASAFTGGSLSTSCTAGVGACARTGTWICSADRAGTTCSVTAGTPSTEVCDGVDNDCDGMVDEGLTRSCYGGASGTAGVGACRSGTETCAAGSWGTCVGEVRPSTEVCDNVDNDCDGATDETLTRSCYTGAAGTSGVGTCRPGTQTCSAGSWGSTCPGEVVPRTERCDSLDDNCNGTVDDPFIGGVGAAPSSPRVLVFSPAEGSAAPAYPAGSVVTRVTDAAWRSMTRAQFETYHMIVIGSGCSYSGCQALYDTRNTWAPAVTGRIIVETSHALEHAQYTGPQAWMRWIVSGNGTGLYVSDDDDQRPLDFMAPFGGITSQSDGYTPGIIVAPGHPAMSGVSDSDITMGSNHASMTAWPSTFTVLARPNSSSSPLAMVLARNGGASGTGLGSTCTAGVGACVRTGTYVCTADGSGTECSVAAGMPTLEVCDNVDNDCDGMTDESLTRSCYGGPTGTAGVGACRAGTETCAAGAWGSCAGEVRPATETCDNADNDCDGTVDETLTRSCYTGAAGTSGVGTCRPGTQTCSMGSWGSTCTGEVVPRTERCDSLDDNCNGAVDEPFLSTTFRVDALSASGCSIVDHNGVTGDDRGGIAVSSASVFYSGDSNGVRLPLNLSSQSGLGRIYDAITSDLRTGRVYSFGVNATTVLPYGGGAATHLIEIDGTTGALTGTAVALSTAISLPSGTGIFAGWGRVVVHNTSRVYSISLPTGAVTDLGAVAIPPHSGCESWAYWGVAEYFGGVNYITYVRDAGAIERMAVPSGTRTVVATFSSLGDMCSFTVSPGTNRWYFHYEGGAQFGGSAETVGYCGATLTTSSGSGLGDACTAGVGACLRTGTVVCDSMQTGTACTATASMPTPEVCNNVDDDCDGTVDEGLTRSCYTGAAGTAGVGACRAGTQTCSMGSFGTACSGEVLPSAEVCDGVDNDCDGMVDEALTRSCYTGASGTSGVGTCRPGTQTCSMGSWGSTCPGEVVPRTELCDSLDDNCNGVVDDPFLSTAFQINALSAGGCSIIDHNGVTGDDRGGIAVSSASVFYNGDSNAVRAPLNLSTQSGVGRIYDAIASDLRTGRVYTFGTSATAAMGSGGTATHLIELDGTTGAQTSTAVALSTAISLPSGTGIFAGWGRVVVHNTSRVYSISLPTGVVTDLGAVGVPSHSGCESWAYWGVAEYFGGVNYITYVRDAGAIERMAVPSGTRTVVATFSSLGDMCSFTVSPGTNRWYFHYEGGAQFGGSAETLGYCGATFTTGAGTGCTSTVLSGAVYQVVGLSPDACQVVDHNAVTSDDRGGIALSAGQVFYTGDGATGRFAASNLSGGTSVGRIIDGLFSDLATQQVYSLGTAAGPFEFTFGSGTYTLDRFFAIDGNSGAVGAATMLSAPIVFQDYSLGYNTQGIFSGMGRVVVVAAGRVYDIALPSGLVVDRGAFTFPGHTPCESAAVFGVAEFFGGALYIDYVQSNTVIARQQVAPTAGAPSTLATFTNLSDMCSFTVSPQTNRWYFHHEYGSQFGGSSETVGYCNMVRRNCREVLAAGGTASGVYTIDPDGSGPLGFTQVYCDQANDGGGWTLVGRLGDPRYFPQADRNLGAITAPGGSGNLLHTNYAAITGTAMRVGRQVGTGTNTGNIYQISDCSTGDASCWYGRYISQNDGDTFGAWLTAGGNWGFVPGGCTNDQCPTNGGDRDHSQAQRIAIFGGDCHYTCASGGDDSRNGLTYRDYGDATTPSRVGNQATWGAGTVTPGATALGTQISIVDYGQGATDWRDLWIR